MTDSNRGSFGSKIGLILATAGGAVGLGNVWRFPYMAGQEGGAAFILVYIGSVLLLGIPCMISEFIIGRHGASNTARAYTKLSNGTAWKWVGYLQNPKMNSNLISIWHSVNQPIPLAMTPCILKNSLKIHAT